MSTRESEADRRDRELIELLNELRVILPGVQVLFAFLLTVPFTNRFEEVTNTQHEIYFVTFILTTIATALLIAPSAYHRVRWRQHDKERMLRTSNHLALGGLAFLAAAICGSVYLVTDILYNDAAVIALVTTAAALCYLWLWYGLPLLRRIQDPEDWPGRKT